MNCRSFLTALLVAACVVGVSSATWAQNRIESLKYTFNVATNRYEIALRTNFATTAGKISITTNNGGKIHYNGSVPPDFTNLMSVDRNKQFDSETRSEFVFSCDLSLLDATQDEVELTGIGL